MTMMTIMIMTVVTESTVRWEWARAFVDCSWPYGGGGLIINHGTKVDRNGRYVFFNSTLNFGIQTVLVFHLEVYYKEDRLLTSNWSN